MKNNNNKYKSVQYGGQLLVEGGQKTKKVPLIIDWYFHWYHHAADNNYQKRLISPKISFLC